MISIPRALSLFFYYLAIKNMFLMSNPANFFYLKSKIIRVIFDYLHRMTFDGKKYKKRKILKRIYKLSL